MSHLRKSLQILCVLFVVSLVTSLQTVGAQSLKSRSRIAFVTADYDTRTMTISLIDPVSGAITPLVNEGYFFYPMLSPDGRHLAFIGEHPTRGGTHKLYVMDTDGKNLRPLFSGRVTRKPEGQIAWSPDSSQIIYGAIDGNGQPAGFFRVGLDGKNPTEIVFQDVGKRFYSTWITSSPDGNRLAIIVQTNGNPNFQLYIANADGSNPLPVTATTPNGQTFTELVWSPDSQQTLLSANTMIGAVDPQPLMLGDTIGANVKTLISPPPNYINSLSWSPDGSQIAFIAPESRESKPDGGVWVANVNGSDLHVLNIPINVGFVGTSWRVIPDDVVLPGTPTSFTNALKK
jgi:Tol biopolymer transport system component